MWKSVVGLLQTGLFAIAATGRRNSGRNGKPVENRCVNGARESKCEWGQSIGEEGNQGIKERVSVQWAFA